MVETRRLSLGNAELVLEPGSAYKYSGAGFTVLQMVIEDVTGESFDTFVERSVTGPLGMGSAGWAWSPELRAAAPVPYGNEGQALEYRQLANHAIGSEIMTVPDFARFVAATVVGPDGEPAGRGVLRPDTIYQMITAQPGAAREGAGLGYGLGTLDGARSVTHSGANSGWTAFFILDTRRREGFVIASASLRGGPMHLAVLNRWLDAFYPGQRTDPPPAPALDPTALLTLGLAAIVGLPLPVLMARSARDLAKGRLTRRQRPTLRSLLPALPWMFWLLFNWYTVYSPLPVYLPAGFPDFWPSPATAVLLAVLAAWTAYRVAVAFTVRSPRPVIAGRAVPSGSGGHVESATLANEPLR